MSTHAVHPTRPEGRSGVSDRRTQLVRPLPAQRTILGLAHLHRARIAADVERGLGAALLRPDVVSKITLLLVGIIFIVTVLPLPAYVSLERTRALLGGNATGWAI